MLSAQEICKALETQSYTYEECSAIIKAIKSNKNLLAQESIKAFRVGDKVKWHSRKNPLGTGIIIKVNSKNCQVSRDSDGTIWTVPATILKLA